MKLLLALAATVGVANAQWGMPVTNYGYGGYGGYAAAPSYGYGGYGGYVAAPTYAGYGGYTGYGDYGVSAYAPAVDYSAYAGRTINTFFGNVGTLGGTGRVNLNDNGNRLLSSNPQLAGLLDSILSDTVGLQNFISSNMLNRYPVQQAGWGTPAPTWGAPTPTWGGVGGFDPYEPVGAVGGWGTPASAWGTPAVWG